MSYTPVTVILMFFVYAFMGWCAEVAFAACKTGKFVNRGFLNGPVCPIYGFGLVAVILALTPLEDRLFLLFIASMAVTTVLELITGWVLEKAFHMKWWDYSGEKFNIGGYVCLEFSILWGFAAMFVLKIVHPLVYSGIMLMPDTVKTAVAAIFLIIIAIDCASTVSAILKLQKRLAVISGLAGEMRELSDTIGDAISERVIRTFDAAVETKGMYAELLEMIQRHKEEEKALAEANRRAEQELWDNIKDVNKSRRDRYEALKKREDDGLSGLSRIHNRLIKAFPNMKTYGYDEALGEIKKYSEKK